MAKARTSPLRSGFVHVALIIYTLIALFPVFLIIINSFKDRASIFRNPLGLPNASSFSLVGYNSVLTQGDFTLYFQNSLIVTSVSIFFVLLFGAMAAFALSEYRFRGNSLMGLYLALGIMIPIRLGTVAILQGMVATGLVNTLTALILVYTAQGLPLAVFILTEFMRTVSDDLKNAGRIDGLTEYSIDHGSHSPDRRLGDPLLPDLARHNAAAPYHPLEQAYPDPAHSRPHRPRLCRPALLALHR